MGTAPPLSPARLAISARGTACGPRWTARSTSLLHNLATNPDQFERLKAEPALIAGAVFEGVRHSATVRWFSRVAKSTYIDADVLIPAGARVMILYGSANRDERHYEDSDRFDVSRHAADQLGWGTGPHLCAGMNLARMEMEVMLEALVEQVGKMNVGMPIHSDNRGLYGFSHLPMSFSS